MMKRATHQLACPTGPSTPLVVEIPHAGLAVPEEVCSTLQVAGDELERDADLYVDDLYRDAPRLGATVLKTTISRYVVDLNRAPDDVDGLSVTGHPSARRTSPRGVIWRMTTNDRTALARPLSMEEFQRRMREYYFPYHACLQQRVDAFRSQHGFVVILAAHSMPSQGRPGHMDTGARRADVVPGTQGRTTADPTLIELVDSHFREAGLTVAHDTPYRGGWTTSHYGRPDENVHAIQIELNRALYMNERTLQPKDEAFDALRRLLNALVTKVGRLRLSNPIADRKSQPDLG